LLKKIGETSLIVSWLRILSTRERRLDSTSSEVYLALLMLFLGEISLAKLMIWQRR
jgi:hypothetical protein